MNENTVINQYKSHRNALVSANSNLVGVVLNEKEEKLNDVLKELKTEYKNACKGEIPYNMPVLTDQRIWDSRLYDFCHRLPKGSDLHVHGTALLPSSKIIDFVLNHEELLIDLETGYLVNKGREEGKRCLTLKAAFEEGFFTRAQLEKQWTMLGIPEDKNVWKEFEQLFAYSDALDTDPKILHDYYLEAFRYYLNNNIFHIEIHILLTDERDVAENVLRVIRDAYYQVKCEDPRLSVNIIASAFKLFDFDLKYAERCLTNAVYFHEVLKDESIPGNVSDFVIGFDLVNEEDTSRPLSEYAEVILKIKRVIPKFKLFLHCGESLSVEVDSLIDAYLLGATRVGHGMNLYRYPSLLRQYAEKEICLEVCPLSNQQLGYVADLRLHPGFEYLKRGVTISICSDDPIFMEHEALTDDFFSVITCWDLGVAEIKHQCINSIMYSGLDEVKKKQLRFDWLKAWNEFVDSYAE